MSREDGSATVEFVWLSILLLVPFVYVVLAVFDTQRAAYAVSSASHAAARAYVRAPDPQTGTERAEAAARVALGDHDVTARVEVVCLPSRADCLTPGSSVRVVVRSVQPLPLTPAVLGEQLGGIAVDSEHTEPFGQFREAR